jgi:hypothetical protein
MYFVLRSLTRARRSRAGQFLALIYMLCVLAPSLAYSFSDGALVAPCLIASGHRAGSSDAHDHSAVGHVHSDGLGPQLHSHMQPDPVSLSLVENEASSKPPGAAVDRNGPTKDHQKSTGGQCCGSACLSALPATLASFTQPSRPMALCESEDCMHIAARASSAHYRPPIYLSA